MVWAQLTQTQQTSDLQAALAQLLSFGVLDAVAMVAQVVVVAQVRQGLS